ncbi:MAG: veratrol--corrinoid protein metyltransferase, partial [Oscillospiraceae bacterium]|nr:veratrol--corrinoid protein metyltransferase [Oscillospiraceae bacterium]
RHDCGKSEQFIDDWLDLGVSEWNPAQISNDLKAVKRKYTGRLALSGCWDSQGPLGSKSVGEKALKDALVEYTDTFAPGGGFTFGAMIGGLPDDAEANAKRDIIKEFFFDYARDWYKTH